MASMVTQTTRAIVLRSFPYSDKQVVVRAYTERFGARSYGVAVGGRSGVARGFLAPLSRVEIVCTEAVERDVQRLRELRMEAPSLRSDQDPLRGVLALYAQEVLYHALRNEAPDQRLFQGVHAAIEMLDATDRPELYPMWLLVGLLVWTGHAPDPGEDDLPYFNPRTAEFVASVHDAAGVMDRAATAFFRSTLVHWPAMAPGASTATARREALDGVLLLLRELLPGFGTVKAPEILHAVLHTD